MFDRSLEKSELYFAVLQILCIMSEWIYESATDLENQKEAEAAIHQNIWSGDAKYFSENRREIERGIINSNWDKGIINSNWDLLLSHHAKVVKVLQDRIDRKTKEVESLRDGVIFQPNQINASINQR
jgi:hypothetical protein